MYGMLFNQFYSFGIYNIIILILQELLTPRGWASAYTVEAVLMQFAASLVKGQGRVARKPKNSKDFSRLVKVFFKRIF